MGVFYMISVLKRAGVLLKTEEVAKDWRYGMPGGDPKKNEKIFGKRFDKAEKCAIVYITRLIRSELLKRRGVILEREPMMGR